MNVKKAVGITDYNAYVEKKAPKTKLFSPCVRAFLVGGAICVLGELLNSVAKDSILLDEEQAGMFTSMCLIFLGALFTGLGVYDVLGRFAGAGSIVPITGFANSIVAPAVDFKQEGYILGVGAKMFLIAGPVLVYGIVSSCAVGVVYWIITMLGGG